MIYYILSTYFGQIQHDIEHSITVTKLEWCLYFEVLKHTSYLALSGKLCDVFCQFVGWPWMGYIKSALQSISQIARFMGPTWGPSGSCRPQMGPMLAPWTLLSGLALWHSCCGVTYLCPDFLQPVIQGDSRHLPWEDVASSKDQIHHGQLGNKGSWRLTGTGKGNITFTYHSLSLVRCRCILNVQVSNTY